MPARAQGLLPDETHIQHPDWNMAGTLAFSASGPHSRGTQVFVNYDDNQALDEKREIVPFGRMVSGMSTLQSVYTGYRERPSAAEIRRSGEAYLAQFPRLSRIVSAQQVAFVEEPFALSKNAKGFVITIVMVAMFGLCCLGARLLITRVAAKGLSKGKREEILRKRLSPRYDEDDDDVDDEEGDEDADGGDGDPQPIGASAKGPGR